MRLSELAAAVESIAGQGILNKGFHQDAEITGLTIDSRTVRPGDAFICLPGLRVDGHSFARMATEKGAAALVVERELEIELPQILVNDARAAASLLAQKFYGTPAKEMKMIGVGGTKGKTTTCFLIYAIAQAAGLKCGLIGSAMNMIGAEIVEEKMTTPTTPDPVELQWLLRKMADAGCDWAAMEVTAHALDMRRVKGMFYDAGVFTNFSQDHLDYFGTMDSYFDAKRRFYDPEYCGWAAVNADDDRVHQLLNGIPASTFGVSNAADAYARDIEIREDGLSFTLVTQELHLPLHLRLSGLFNVYNALAAASVCLHMGIAPEDVKKGLEGVKRVPGRLEIIETETPYHVYIDHAHSPESLRIVLETVRQFTKGRLICLFGCGGDRDRIKRPLMGKISGEMADYTVLTSDNPRTENPGGIIDEIEAGMRKTSGVYSRIENRREAIHFALDMAREGDIIILAGKGHEEYQEISGQKLPFSEKEIVLEHLGK